MNLQRIPSETALLTIRARHPKVHVLFPCQNMARNTRDCSEGILTAFPLTSVLVIGGLSLNIRVTLIQVTFDNRHQGALALCAGETKGVATGSVAPETSTFFLLQFSSGPRVTAIVHGTMRTVRCDGHA